MKLLILTTQTTHHAKFVQDFCDGGFDVRVVLETKALKPSFDTTHPYLSEQDQYEKNLWFDGGDLQIKGIAETYETENANSEITQNLIKEFQPDLVVVFGTGKILPCIIDLLPDRILNLHGGDPEHYRGLDTHLWAVYHGDFDQLITCLHAVAPALDTGEVVGKMSIPFKKGMDLYQLRAENTACCTALVREAVQYFEQHGKLKMVPQGQAGRYYSFMPSVLKEICVQKFRRYTRDLA